MRRHLRHQTPVSPDHGLTWSHLLNTTIYEHKREEFSFKRTFYPPKLFNHELERILNYLFHGPCIVILTRISDFTLGGET